MKQRTDEQADRRGEPTIDGAMNSVTAAFNALADTDTELARIVLAHLGDALDELEALTVKASSEKAA